MDINVPGNPGGGNICGLKPFITSRRTALLAELGANGCSVGISENNVAAALDIYPNPADNILFLNTNEQLKKIQVFSADGKTVIEILSPQSKQIDLKNISSGIYFLKVTTTENKTGTKKFIKE
jgi:hypothetical protein